MGAPRQVGLSLMTLSAFEVLGVTPELGRLPTAEEAAPNGPSVALLSHDLWASQYGSDPSIVGKTVQVNGIPREVIGVMPGDYDFPTPQVEVWTPWQLNAASTNFGAHYIQGIARLSPGVTIESAIGDARSLVARYGELGYGPQWFESTYDCGAVVRPIRDVIVGDAPDAADRIRHGGVRVADRLRQRREPAPRSRRGAAARERSAHDARVEPRAARKQTLVESALVRADGGRRWSDARLRGKKTSALLDGSRRASRASPRSK